MPDESGRSHDDAMLAVFWRWCTVARDHVGIRLVSLGSTEKPERPLPVATPIAASESTVWVRCPHCGGEHPHEIVGADDSLIRRSACVLRLFYRLDVEVPRRTRSQVERHPRPQLAPDHPLSRARAAGITAKEVVEHLNWSAQRTWGRRTAAETEKMARAVNELTAAKTEKTEE